MAFGIGAASTWWFRTDIFQFLLVPADGNLSPFEGGPPVFSAPTDMLGATISLALRGGIVAAIPVVAFGTFTLVRPLLMPTHQRIFIIFVPSTAVFFLGGAAFAYYVMLPVSLDFLLHFGNDIAVPLISITEYLDLLMALMFWLGIVFELPLMMFLVAKLDVISYQRMRNMRKFVPAFAFILSAVITPTFDALNQTMVAIPIIVLYEVGLFLAFLAHPERGNYMFVRSIWASIAWVVSRPKAAYRKVRR